MSVFKVQTHSFDQNILSSSKTGASLTKSSSLPIFVQPKDKNGYHILNRWKKSKGIIFCNLPLIWNLNFSADKVLSELIHLLVYAFSITSLVLQQQKWIAVTKISWSTKAGPLQKKIADTCFKTSITIKFRWRYTLLQMKCDTRSSTNKAFFLRSQFLFRKYWIRTSKQNNKIFQKLVHINIQYFQCLL